MDEIIDQLALASAAVILYPPFFFYTKRGARLHSNSFGCVLPVSLWMLVERVLLVLDVSIPSVWETVSIVLCFALILLMIVVSLKQDFSLYAVFNILGNLFVMYALPSVIYIVLVSVLIFGGGSALILLGIPLLAFGFALSEHRISFTIIFIPARAWSGWLGSANGPVPVLHC